MLTPRFDSRPAMTMVGLALNTTPGSPQIPVLWQSFFESNRTYPVTEPGVAYGVMQLDRSSGVLRYMAGEPSGAEPPEGMTVWLIAAGEYAVFEATLENVSQVFSEIYGTWLPNAGFERGEGPDLERYGQEFGPNNPRFEVLIPVRKVV